MLRSFIKNNVPAISNSLKLNILVKVSPVVFSLTGGYFLYQRLLQLNSSDLAFTKQEEKAIGKKLSPVLKYKYIEKLYSKHTKEHQIVSKLYSSIIKELNCNLSSEVFLFESDHCYLHLLPNGNLYLSDQLYFSICKEKNFDLLTYIILHSLVHVKLHHVSESLPQLYGVSDLKKQYTSLMEQETGFEHYFMHYYLYMPFSKKQEIAAHTKTLLLMKTHKFLTKDIELDSYFENKDPKEVKAVLKAEKTALDGQSLKQIVEAYKKLTQSLSCLHEHSQAEAESSESPEKAATASASSSKVIYGDFFDKKEIEVSLQQRSTRKIKYKKTAFEENHKFDEEIQGILNKYIEEELSNQEKMDKYYKEKNRTYNFSTKTVPGSPGVFYECKKQEQMEKIHNNLIDLKKDYDRV